MIGKNAFDFIHPDDLVVAIGMIKHGIEIPGFMGTVEVRYMHKNGSWRVFEAVGVNMIHEPAVNGIVINARDITERKKAEHRIIRLNRLYSVLSKANEAIVHVHEPEKLYQEVCRIIVEDGSFRMAWIGVVDPEPLLVKPVAIYGHEDGYLKEKHVSVDESIPEGRGPTGTAIRTGGYFVCNDIENDPLMKPWREEALKRGYRSSAAFALKKAGKLIRTINVYSSMAYFFQEEEIILFKSLAEDISYAIESIEIEKQRRQAEEALKESEEKYRILFETSIDGIYQTDANNVFTLINMAGAEIFGYKTPDEMIGRPVIDFWGEPKDREVFFKRLKRSKYVESYPVKARKRDGETIHLEISSRILEDEQANFRGIEGIIRDITKRVKAEESLRESEIKFRALTLSTASAIFIYREKFLYANPAAEALSGYTAEEILEINFWDVVHPDFRELVKERGAARLRGEAVPDRYEFKILTKSGEERWIDFTAGMITYEGKPAGLGTAFDITERKKAEDEIKKRVKELEEFYEMAVGRELKMKEIKEEIARLKAEISSYKKE